MRVHTDWLLTPERAALHLPTATAVIADLHLGYDQVRCWAGEALPAFGLDDTLAALKALVVRHEVRHLLIAGDMFEDGRRPDTAAELLDWLGQNQIELLGVVPGNHDRGLDQAGVSWPLYPEGVRLGGWHIVHGDGRLPRGRVIHGHVHPCLRWGKRHAVPCFLVGARRLILPAFSADAVGVNVAHDPRYRFYRCCLPAGDRVLDFGPAEKIYQKLSGG
jgi:putative SbcD/Mre11-related phosphoesterase